MRRAKGVARAEWWLLVRREEKGMCLVRCLRVWWRMKGKPKKGFMFLGRGERRHLSERHVRKVVKAELRKVGVGGDRFSSYSL